MIKCINIKSDTNLGRLNQDTWNVCFSEDQHLGLKHICDQFQRKQKLQYMTIPRNLYLGLA